MKRLLAAAAALLLLWLAGDAQTQRDDLAEEQEHWCALERIP